MQSIREKVIQKVLKIKKLADEGKAGEKEAAKKKLILLMDKYDLTDNDLNETKLYFWYYKRTDTYSSQLLQQVIYSVMGDVELKCHNRKSDIGCNCTKAEAVEIEAKYNFYYAAYKNELKIFYHAFVMSNSIYPSEDKVQQEKKDKTISEEAMKAYLLSKSMEPARYHKQLN